LTRFVVESAGPAQDAELRALLAANPMAGAVAISFRREPSYFLATELQGGFRQVFVLRDRETGRVIGAAARTTRAGFLNGELCEVGYLGDLRLDPAYRGSLLFLEAFHQLARLHQDGRTPLYFTVIAEGNQAVRDALTGLARLKPRPGLPRYRDLGRILSPAINLLGRRPDLSCDARIVRPGPEHRDGILACLNRNMARRQFAPHFSAGQFRAGETEGVQDQSASPLSYPTLHGFQLLDGYVALREERVVGYLGFWDQAAFKQSVITGYHGRLRWTRPLLNLGAGLLGWPRYPAPGQELRSFYACFPAVDEDDPAVFAALVRTLYNDHIRGPHAYFLLGLHEQDPLAAVLGAYTCTPYAGRLYAVHFPADAPAFDALDQRIPHIELATL